MTKDEAINYAQALSQLDMNPNTAKLISDFWNEQMKNNFDDSEFLVEIHRILGTKVVASILYIEENRQ